MRREAVMALQEGVEASMLNFLENSNLAALHGKRGHRHAEGYDTDSSSRAMRRAEKK